MSAAAPRKSIRLRADVEECLTGTLTVKKTMMPETTVSGTLRKSSVSAVCLKICPLPYDVIKAPIP